MTSIRRRLLIALFTLWVSVWVAIALITLNRAGHEIGELLDAQLAQTARVLAALWRPTATATPGAPPLSPVGHPYEAKLSCQYWQGGRLRASFGAAPGDALGQGPGFSDHEVGGLRWRVFGLPGAAPDEMLFVAQSYSIRQELINYLTVQALWPVLWSLPLAAALIWLAVGDGLRPLTQLARSIARRSPAHLEPVDAAHVPLEVRPITDALNQLLGQLAGALAGERRFAADASHELRTPFAIIRTHAQIARRSQDAAERQQALDHLLLGVERASRLIGQLLTLARLQDGPSPTAGATALTQAVTRAVAERTADARLRGLVLTATTPEGDPVVIAARPVLIELLLRNLIDNGLKFTPAPGWVHVELGLHGQTPVLRVSDAGPGIPAPERARVFDRFYRSREQRVAGTGLGLAIVGQVCALLKASIALRDGPDGRGLCVEVTFPARSVPG